MLEEANIDNVHLFGLIFSLCSYIVYCMCLVSDSCNIPHTFCLQQWQEYTDVVSLALVLLRRERFLQSGHEIADVGELLVTLMLCAHSIYF